MNEYFGSDIQENEYAVRWLEIFKTKEKDIDLLMDIVECDSENEEDKSIGYQMIAVFILDNDLWISAENYHDIIKGMVACLSTEEIIEVKFARKRRDQIFKLNSRFFQHGKIVRHDYNPYNDIADTIEKQIVNGGSIEEALGWVLNSLMDIATNKYKMPLQIGLPDIVVKSLVSIRDELMEYGEEYNGEEIMKIAGRISSIVNKKVWNVGN